MIVDIPSEYRVIEKINTAYKFLYICSPSSSYIYGKKNESEYFYNSYIPSGRKVRINIEDMIKEFPDCIYHAFMYDSRMPFDVFYYTNNDDHECEKYSFIEVEK